MFSLQSWVLFNFPNTASSCVYFSFTINRGKGTDHLPILVQQSSIFGFTKALWFTIHAWCMSTFDPFHTVLEFTTCAYLCVPLIYLCHSFINKNHTMPYCWKWEDQWSLLCINKVFSTLIIRGIWKMDAFIIEPYVWMEPLRGHCCHWLMSLMLWPVWSPQGGHDELWVLICDTELFYSESFFTSCL